MHEFEILKKIFPSIVKIDNTITIDTNYGPVLLTLPLDYPKSLPEIKLQSQEIYKKLEPFLKNVKLGNFMIYSLIYLIYSVAEDNNLNAEIVDIEEITEEMYIVWKGKRTKNVGIKDGKYTGKMFFLEKEEK